MAGGSLLENFTTLMESQGPVWMTGPDTWVQDVSRNTFTLPRITTGNRGAGMTNLIQGGDVIQDRILLSTTSTFVRYNPDATHDAPNPQIGTNITQNWSFGSASISWNKQEIGLNRSMHGKKYIAQKFKDVMMEKHTNLWVSVCEAIDDEFWSQPDAGRMESTTPTGARVPLSIPCAVNEFPNGLTTAAVDAGGTLWTTIHGVAPATYANWVCQQEGYTFTGATAIGAATIFAPLSRAFYSTTFDRLPKNEQYSDKKTSPHVILTSLTGMANYEFALRANQDEFRGMGTLSGQDPAYGKPTFRGIPMDYVSPLATATIYPTAVDEGESTELDTANATNTGGIGFAGPRYYFINGEYLKFIVHSENYCVLEKPIIPDGKPFNRAQFMDLWNNNVFRSLRRHAILYPSADTTNA